MDSPHQCIVAKYCGGGAGKRKLTYRLKKIFKKYVYIFSGIPVIYMYKGSVSFFIPLGAFSFFIIVLLLHCSIILCKPHTVSLSLAVFVCVLCPFSIYGGGELRQKVSGCPVFFPLMGRNFTTYKKASNEGGVLISTTEVVHFSATSSSFSGRFFGAPLRPPQTSKRLLLQNQKKIYIFCILPHSNRVFIYYTIHIFIPSVYAHKHTSFLFITSAMYYIYMNIQILNTATSITYTYNIHPKSSPSFLFQQNRRR